MAQRDSKNFGLPARRLALTVLALVTVAVAVTFYLTHRPQHGLERVVAVEPAKSFHAVIFRYDTELSNNWQLEALMAQDLELGIRASAFPLVEDFQTLRNVLHRYAVDSGEVQLHARPMPRSMSQAFVLYGDLTPYRYQYLDKNEVLRSFISNLHHELHVFGVNGFAVRGFSLHANSNRLPWSDEINYQIFAASAAVHGLDWVSVTTNQFSLGPAPERLDAEKFNGYDREVTVAQSPRWVTYRTGVFATRKVLVIPTGWRDRYGIGLRGQTDIKAVYRAMREDIDRQWEAARRHDYPFVLMMHPYEFAKRKEAHDLNTALKQYILERARALEAPVMTMSEYFDALKADG